MATYGRVTGVKPMFEPTSPDVGQYISDVSPQPTSRSVQVVADSVQITGKDSPLVDGYFRVRICPVWLGSRNLLDMDVPPRLP
jgi:hypothetical protein